jgi:hypothetical protein
MFRCILAISQGMERVDIGRPAIYLLHLNWTIWRSLWAWGRILHKLTLKDHLGLYHMAR